MRLFRQGRVGEIPSTSSASVAFVMAFNNPNKKVWGGWGGCVCRYFTLGLWVELFFFDTEYKTQCHRK